MITDLIRRVNVWASLHKQFERFSYHASAHRVVVVSRIQPDSSIDCHFSCNCFLLIQFICIIALLPSSSTSLNVGQIRGHYSKQALLRPPSSFVLIAKITRRVYPSSTRVELCLPLLKSRVWTALEKKSLYASCWRRASRYSSTLILRIWVWIFACGRGMCIPHLAKAIPDKETDALKRPYE